MQNIVFRTLPQIDDLESIKNLLISTKFFHDDEVEVAVSLIQETLDNPNEYQFIFAEIDNVVVGYTCFGLISCTVSSYDLFWIAVHNDYRNHGIGKQLLNETIKLIKQQKGTNLYAETSGTTHYAPTRYFYLNNNFTDAAQIKDFYDVGDDKIIYSKKLN